MIHHNSNSHYNHGRLHIPHNHNSVNMSLLYNTIHVLSDPDHNMHNNSHYETGTLYIDKSSDVSDDPLFK